MQEPIFVQSSYQQKSILYRCFFTGQDLNIALMGGDFHIGSCSLALPYRSRGKQVASISTIEREGHRDGELASLLAKKIARAVNRVTLLACGIHFDNLDDAELKELIELCINLTDQLILEIIQCG